MADTAQATFRQGTEELSAPTLLLQDPSWGSTSRSTLTVSPYRLPVVGGTAWVCGQGHVHHTYNGAKGCAA
jgi:hypothetical protein